MLIKVLDSKIHACKDPVPKFMGRKELKKLAGLLRHLTTRAMEMMEQVQREKEAVVNVDDVSEVYTNLVLVLQMSAALLTRSDGKSELKGMLVEDGILELTTGERERENQSKRERDDDDAYHLQIYCGICKRHRSSSSRDSATSSGTAYGCWAQCVTRIERCRIKYAHEGDAQREDKPCLTNGTTIDTAGRGYPSHSGAVQD